MPQTDGVYQTRARGARSRGCVAAIAALSVLGAAGAASAQGIETEGGNAEIADFDVVHAQVTIDGSDAVFRMAVAGEAGGTKPEPTGALAGAEVFAYVWPTSIDPAEAGFESGAGILAMAVTAHPDFDDTPLYDGTADGNAENDGNEWHSHWVVLGPDEACGPDALKVIDIPDGTEPPLPETWPGLALLIDSPGYEPCSRARLWKCGRRSMISQWSRDRTMTGSPRDCASMRTSMRRCSASRTCSMSPRAI